MRIPTLLKYIKHRLLLVMHRFSSVVTYEDALGEALDGVAGRWHGEIDPVFSYLVMMDYLKQSEISGEALELGGGYSTVLFCQLVDRLDLKLETVDINPDKYLRILPRKKIRDYVFSRVGRIDQLTVSLEEVEAAYGDYFLDATSQYNDEEFFAVLNKYTRYEDDGNAKEWRELIENKADLTKNLLGLPEFESEKSFYSENNALTGIGYCKSLVAASKKYDFIFFDCGEYSSLAEWAAMEGSIKKGGYALLHDIYYPKSVKNFLVATLIDLSPDWEIVYIDRVSAQGCLVAKKLTE